eukprot:g4217.t1
MRSRLSRTVMNATEMETLGAEFGRRAAKIFTTAKCGARPTVLMKGGSPGVGKTVFARGFVRACCGDETLEVVSPSYCLDVPYDAAGDAGLHHIDLYRLQESRFEDMNKALGLDDVFLNNISIIEWAEPIFLQGHLKDMIEESLVVEIQDIDARTRLVQAESRAEAWFR